MEYKYKHTADIFNSQQLCQNISLQIYSHHSIIYLIFSYDHETS